MSMPDISEDVNRLESTKDEGVDCKAKLTHLNIIQSVPFINREINIILLSTIWLLITIIMIIHNKAQDHPQ